MQQSSYGSEIREKQEDRIQRIDKEMKDVKENVLEIKSLLKKSTPPDENDRRIEWFGKEMKGMREEISSLLRRSTLRSTGDETDHNFGATHYNLGK